MIAAGTKGEAYDDTGGRMKQSSLSLLILQGYYRYPELKGR
jgi:hypothetical protein